jgi:hypothetical protein
MLNLHGGEICCLVWPSGQVDTLKNLDVNQVLYVKEGEGLTRAVKFLARSI